MMKKDYRGSRARSLVLSLTRTHPNQANLQTNLRKETHHFRKPSHRLEKVLPSQPKVLLLLVKVPNSKGKLLHNKDSPDQNQRRWTPTLQTPMRRVQKRNRRESLKESLKKNHKANQKFPLQKCQPPKCKFLYTVWKSSFGVQLP